MKIEENVQPAYAEGFGVAGAHLSRRSGSEAGTLNAETVGDDAVVPWEANGFPYRPCRFLRTPVSGRRWSGED
jgi:hypothetical protein